MNGKIKYLAGATAFAAVTTVSIVLYAQKDWVWLLCITGCAVTACLLCVAGLLRAYRLPAGGMQKAYRKKATYISAVERDFLRVLREITGDKYEVCVQAPLVAVIDKVSGGAFRNELFRVADYLIADAVSYEPLLLIELNDASHNRADRRARDRKVAEICADARMPLLSFTVAQAHDVPEVRKTVLKALHSGR